MPIHNLICAICEEDFDNNNVIHSTYCGHVFHKNCLDSWKLRRRSCPMCQRDFGQSRYDHQLFLHFENQQENFEELETKLRNIKLDNDQIHIQKDEMEFKFLQLQAQFTASEESKLKLEQKIRENACANDNFLQLQRQYTDSLEEIKNLEELIKQMKTESEKKAQELILKSVESSYLKKCLESGEISSDSSLKEHVKMLEQKLKYVGEQLEKEIANSTRISIEKMKLESYIEMTKGKLTEPSNSLNESANISRKNNVPRIADTNNSLVIEGILLEHITSSLKNFVINLGRSINLPIRNEDICDVRILDKSECKQKADNIFALLVNFLSENIKNNFLANKSLLRNNSITSSYIVRQYAEKNNNHLYEYAKENLRHNGFVTVFCRNNKVFAKKHETSQPMLINNRRHVENLVKFHIEETKRLQNHEIDENFYQL